MHTLNLTLNAHTAEELEVQLRCLRVAITHRVHELQDRQRQHRAAGTANDKLEENYTYRIAFLDGLRNQMFEQEAEWLNKAKALTGR